MADGQANPQQPLATLPPDVAALTRAFPPTQFPPPVSQAQMDENSVMQRVSAIPDKQQQIIQGTGLGLSPMISKENDDAQLVPPSQVTAAQQSGYRHATLMRNTKGELHLVGNDEVQDAVNNDWTINRATPSPAPYVPKPQPPQMREMMGLTSGPEAPAAAQLLNPGEIIRTLGNKYALPWLQANAQQNLAEEQRELNKAVGPESATTSLPAQAAYTALAPVHRAAALTSSVIGAGLTDRNAQAAIAAGVADPAIPLAYFGAQGFQGATGIGTGAKGSVREAWENPTPENWSKALTDLGMMFGAAEGARPGTVPLPSEVGMRAPLTPEAAGEAPGIGQAPVDTGYGASLGLFGRGVSKAVSPFTGMLQRAWDPEALSATQAATKAFRPRNAKANWQEEIARSLPIMRRSADAMGIDVNDMTPDEALQATDDAARESWAEYKRNHLGPNADVTVNTQPVADAMRATIDNTMREQDPALAAEIERIAQTFDNREMSIGEVQDRVSTLNNQTRNIEAKYPRDRAAAKIAPENEYKFVQRDTLRGLMDEQLNQLTGPGAAELRKNYGALRSVQDVIQRRLNVVDRGAREPLAAMMAKAYAAGHIATAILSGHPLGALGGLLTMAAERRSRALQDPNYLTGLAFQKTQPAAPWSPTTPEGPRAPTTAEQVGARAQQLAGAQQQSIPFPEGPLFGVQQTPAPRTGPPYEMPPSSEPAPPAQGQLPPGPEQRALPGGPEPQRQLPGQGTEPRVFPRTGPFAMPPSVIGPQRPALPPATLPERQISPTPGFEAPTAPSASAEQAALQRATAQGRGPKAEIDEAVDNLFTGKQTSIKEAHAKAVSNMLLGASAPPQSMNWDVVRPGGGLPNAIRLNDAAREMVGASIGHRFGGVSMSPATLDTEVLPRLEMAAMAMDNTRAQRPDYFSADAAPKVRDLIRTIQENRGPEGISFGRSEGTPEQQRYTTHEELFHTAVQRRPAAQPGGLAVPDMSDDPGFESMRQRIYNETGRLSSIVHHAEGMADIMQGNAPELTPEQAGASAEEYWARLADRGKQGVQALVDAFKLENFMDDHEKANGYTVDDATNAIRTAGRNALARVLSRQYGTDLRGLARAVQGEPQPANIPSTAGRAGEAGAVPPGGGEANLGSPAETAAGAGRGSTTEVSPGEEPLFSRAPEEEMRGLQSKVENEAKRVSTRKPTGPNAVADPLKNDLQINSQDIHNAGLTENIAHLMEQYPGLRIPPGSTPEQVIAAFDKHARNNLRFMHDNFPTEWREPSAFWYDGANNLATDWARRYDLKDTQTGGVIASQSPQKDWNMNVSLAQRIIEMFQQKDALRYTPKMQQEAKDWVQEIAKDKKNGGPVKAAAMAARLKEIEGRPYNDLDVRDQKSLWFKLFDEAEKPRDYNIYAPDGSIRGKAMTNTPPIREAKVAWGGTKAIAKAISMLENGSRENISNELGDAHKVRSFNNNIVAPNSPSGDVTMDTHAVAADQMRPLAGEDPEVAQNFGSYRGTTSVPHGVKGSYGFHADAYRDVAAENGILPRQEQSMTWEAARSLFPDSFKNPKNKAMIDSIWRDYDAGKITDREARRQIVKAAGGFKPPEWAK